MRILTAFWISASAMRGGVMLMALLSVTDSLRATAAEYDIVIRSGRVVDGTGNPAFFADVAVRGGKVAAIGRVVEKGREEIEALGLIVSPGFIDVHTHADEIAEMPLAENFVRMGVTTIVAGNCGASTLDVAHFYTGVESTNVAVNVTTLVGHNDVREKAMGGGFDRLPTAQEMEKMKALVDRAMKEGAAGLSTGLIYQPGTFSQTDEIVELAKVASRYGGIYTSHMRYEDHDIFKALEEVIRISREAGIRAEVSHIKLAGPTAWGKANQVLDFIERARSEGLDITQDQYAYTASSTGISQLIPDSAFDGGRERFLERLRDAGETARIKEAMIKRLRQKGREDYAYSVVASYRKDPSLNGMNIVEAAKRVRGSDSLDDQVELILEIQRNGGASGVFHGMNEDDLQLFMRHPNTMIACDSGLRKFGSGVPHPRGYGNNARVLARYVRDLKVLRLEEAIRKMTSLPAATFRFEDRGLLKPGFWADIVLFNPETVQDRATFKDPHNYPAGIPWVIVNGTVVLKNGAHTGAKAGMALRRNER